MPRADLTPRCWQPLWPGPRRRAPVEVCQETEEFALLARHLSETLGRCAYVKSIARLQNTALYEECLDSEGFGAPTIMFHGCKTAENERSILAHGFQVNRCRSGGENFGSWFAYRADYSNSGYVHVDSLGLRHIFVCMVSDRYTVREDAIMRVVGQGCAYPLWLVRYTI